MVEKTEYINGSQAFHMCMKKTKEIFGLDRFSPSAGFVYEYVRNRCDDPNCQTSRREYPILKSDFLKVLNRAIKNWKIRNGAFTIPFEMYANINFI